MALPNKIDVDTVRNEDVRERFARTASAYRRRRAQLGLVLVPLVIVFWYSVLFHPKPPWFAAPVFIVFFAALLLGKRILPKLICPTCARDADREIVRFCPECGSSELQMKDDEKHFLLWPTCKACGQELSKKRGGQRLYKIRFCTRCGAYLDERGL